MNTQLPPATLLTSAASGLPLEGSSFTVFERVGGADRITPSRDLDKAALRGVSFGTLARLTPVARAKGINVYVRVKGGAYHRVNVWTVPS